MKCQRRFGVTDLWHAKTIFLMNIQLKSIRIWEGIEVKECSFNLLRYYVYLHFLTPMVMPGYSIMFRYYNWRLKIENYADFYILKNKTIYYFKLHGESFKLETEKTNERKNKTYQTVRTVNTPPFFRERIWSC